MNERGRRELERFRCPVEGPYTSAAPTWEQMAAIAVLAACVATLLLLALIR